MKSNQKMKLFLFTTRLKEMKWTVEGTARNAKERAYGAKIENVGIYQNKNKMHLYHHHKYMDGDHLLMILEQDFQEKLFVKELSLILDTFEIIHLTDTNY